jgi:hypothetical protein
MSTVLFVEELDRAGKVERRHRIEGSDVRIGRSYDNAVILDDARVAASHLQVRIDADDHIAVTACNLDHPFELAGNRYTHRIIDQDAIIVAGETRLRFRTPAYQVATVAQPDRYDWRRPLERPAVSAGLFGLALLATATQGWLQETGVRTALGAAMPIFTAAVAMLVWAGFWSLASRLLVKHHHFQQHLGVVAGLLLGSVVGLDGIIQPLSLVWLPRWAYGVAATALVASWVFAHLRLCSQSNRRPLQLVGLLLAAAAGFLVLNGYNEAHHFSPNIPADVRVISLPASWQPSESPAAFFDDVPDLAKDADEAAKRID